MRQLLWCLMTLTTTIVAPTRSFGLAGGFLRGSEKTCEKENERYFVPLVANDPCFDCICKNKTVVCSRDTCGHLTTCPIVEPATSKHQCCRKCKSCPYLGSNYASGTQWKSSQDPCRLLSCKAGVITMARIQCVTPCRNPERLRGFCCPVCPITNSTALAPIDLTKRYSDPCVQCKCEGNWCHCYKAACDALDCAEADQYVPSGSCCPECRTRRENVPIAGRCVFRRRVYRNEESFRPDPCTLCKCQDEVIFCRKFVCPVLNCPFERLYEDPRVCCPLCRNRDPPACTYGNATYKHGVIWEPDLCTKCKCSNGEVKCASVQCPYSYGCPKGYREKKVSGQCCPTCEEKEATCTLYGNPRYQTFDGKAYNFDGSCRYILAKDCGLAEGADPDFTVVIQSGVKLVDQSVTTKHVTIRLPDGVRVSLMPKKRVKLNSKAISIPHLKLGVFSIINDKRQDKLIFRTHFGLKVLWDGHGYVEVSVPAKYKARMCGLCGNYNHDDSDDFTTKSGSQVTVAATFAQSWKSGSYKSCASAKDQQYHQQLLLWERQNRQKLDRSEEETVATPTPRRFPLLDRRKLPLKADSTEDQLSYERNTIDTGENLAISLLNRGKSDKKPKGKKGPKRRKPTGRLTQICSKGSGKWRTRRDSLAQCALLKSDLFKNCRNKVKVNKYLRSCLLDTCECPSSGRCYCQSLADFAAKCEQKNVSVEWRSHSKCEADFSCPIVGAVFSPCASACVKTCDNADVGDFCASACSPGCACPPSFVLHFDRCILATNCPRR